MGEHQPLWSCTLGSPSSASRARNSSPSDWVFWDSRVSPSVLTSGAWRSLAQRASKRSALTDHAAVYEEGAARYVGGVLRSEEEGQVRHLFGFAHPSEWGL